LGKRLGNSDDQVASHAEGYRFQFGERHHHDGGDLLQVDDHGGAIAVLTTWINGRETIRRPG
jgi:hypothetical protein